jgi:murein DD-endopeptidase MepM/ murein hydrolase activator NlpD
MPTEPSTPSLSLPAPGADRLTTIDRTPTPAAEKAKLGELAAQFESMLMLEMIKQMRKSLLDEEGEGEGLGKETYSSTIDGELALHLAKAGGIGLTPMMVEAWERQQTAVTPGSLVTPVEGRAIQVGPMTAAPAAAPVAVSAIRQGLPDVNGNAAAGDSTLSLEMAGRVSSAYGWRSDPIKRQSKFHGGIDLAARYGTEVPAAAAGTVVTADDQGGYGLTVVIRHPNGFESRYAHLSSLAVSPGESVSQGQQVGRVGSTGRSTGPHLHFEVTQGGRRVDPEQFVRNLTSDTKGQ